MHISQFDSLKSNYAQSLQAFKDSSVQIFRKINSTQVKLRFAQDIFNFFHQYECEIAPFQDFVSQISIIRLGSLESYRQACRVFKIFKRTFANTLKLRFDRRELADFNSENSRNAFLNFCVKNEIDLWTNYSELYFKFATLFSGNENEPVRKKVSTLGEPGSLAGINYEVVSSEKEKEIENPNKSLAAVPFTVEKWASTRVVIKKAMAFREEMLGLTQSAGLFLWDSQTNYVQPLKSNAILFDATESYAVGITKENSVNLYGGLKASTIGNKQYFLDFNDRITLDHSLPVFYSAIEVVKLWKDRVAFGFHNGTLEVYDLNRGKITAEERIVEISGSRDVRIIRSSASGHTNEETKDLDPFGSNIIHSVDLSKNWVAAGGGSKNAVVINLTDPKELPLVFRCCKAGVTVVRMYGEEVLYTAARNKEMVVCDLLTKIPFYRVKHNETSEGEPLDLIPSNQGFYVTFAKSKSIYYYDLRQKAVSVASEIADVNSLALYEGNLYATVLNSFYKLAQRK